MLETNPNGPVRGRQSDAELVADARGAMPPASEAFNELVRRYQRMVYALALSLVRSDDADDVAQEAFLRAFRNLDLLADPAKFGVWLRRITFGVAIDHVRADRARGQTTSALVSGGAGDQPAIPEPADEAPSPLQRIERDEVTTRVRAALDRLPARYRVPLTLYHIDGLSQAKVARALGVPEATVRSLVARARTKLARLLVDAPEVHDMVDASDSTRNAMDVFNDAAREMPRFLHILNGDSVRGTLERSSVPGAFVPYADVLHEGPVPVQTGTPGTLEVRARYIASRGYVTYSEAMRISGGWEAGVAAFREYDEVVLWFEHDLFDQLLLLRHLDWFSKQDLGTTALSLICIGEYPGFEPFHGLGQLDANQLASLLGTREAVSREQMALGTRAWRAFTAPDPTALDALTHDASTAPLPFLQGALQRFLEEYPAVGTGLPRTERQILELLSAKPLSPVQLFLASQRREERVFMGDSTFWSRVRDLAEAATPLVSIDVEPRDDLDLPAGTVSITDAGREVLAGRADAVRLNGLDRWLGGVHLSAPQGGDVEWRYDPSTRRLV
jgi:RNA polymerase sigma factor (sigma-70 family)